MSTSEDLVSTSEALVSTSDALVSTSEDLVSTSEDLVSTSEDLVSTSEDLVSSSGDLVSTSGALVSTSDDPEAGFGGSFAGSVAESNVTDRVGSGPLSFPMASARPARGDFGNYRMLKRPKWVALPSPG